MFWFSLFIYLVTILVQVEGYYILDEIEDVKGQAVSNTLGLLRDNRALFEAQNSTHYSDFYNFAAKYRKVYANIDEGRQRFANFIESIDKIPSLQANNPHARFGTTQFSDLSTKEFIEKFTGGASFAEYLREQRANSKEEDPLYIPPVVGEYDRCKKDAFDWRDKGVVTPIKDQGYCGSCYAFAAAGVVESQVAIHEGRLEDLSPQDIVSCSEWNLGCEGGFIDVTLQYVVENGLASWEDYEYQSFYGDVPECETNHTRRARISGQKHLKAYDEENLKRVVKKEGPVLTCLDAVPLQQYVDGILSQPGGELNHAVVTVGYGGKNPPYWILKNSWDTTFGEEGYFRLERNVNSLNMSFANDIGYY